MNTQFISIQERDIFNLFNSNILFSTGRLILGTYRINPVITAIFAVVFGLSSIKDSIFNLLFIVYKVNKKKKIGK
ncbi:MAG: hypothetical protein ACRCTQ_06260 [Brevinemataceae bacterium]